jgi:hypothetical protein
VIEQDFVTQLLKRPWSATTHAQWLLVISVLTLAMVGCTDGPMFQLKRLNPVIQNQWKKDRERGPVFSQRVDEMRFLKSRIQTMPPNEQAKWIATVNSILQQETSPELRREAALVLAEVADQPDAATTLLKLAQDKNDKVRLTVAQLLKKNPSPQSTQTLLAMASTDSNNSVRQSAIESLGTHRTDDVKQFLTKQLNDRSPSTQYCAALALKDFTGKDFKGDVDLWKKYLAGEPVEPPTTSVAESIQSYVPFLR